MASTNLTEGEKLKPATKRFCSTELNRNLHEQLIFASAMQIFLSVTAFLGNTLILVALHKETSLHPPSKLLYRNLAITDLCVGIIAEPLSVAYYISVLNERGDICVYTYQISFIASNIFCSVSLLTLTAISVDRLLALMLGLRYRQVVTFQRILAFFYCFLDLFSWHHFKFLWKSSYTCTEAAMVHLRNFILVSSHLSIIIHKNFLHSPS